MPRTDSGAAVVVNVIRVCQFLKELLLAWRPGGGKPVWRDPQGGSEREGGGARAAAEICTAAGRHSVATLSHRLAEPPIERRQQQKRTKKMAIPPPPPLDPVELKHVECFQTPRLKISKYAM